MMDNQMDNEKIEFFINQSNSKDLADLLRRLNVGQNPPVEPDVLPHLIRVIEVIQHNSSYFDEVCSFNISNIGKQFISAAINYDPRGDVESDKNKLFLLFVYAYRFLCELELMQDQKISDELQIVKEFVFNNMETFPGLIKQQLIYANYLMPAQILKKFLHNPDVKSFKEFNEQISKAEKLKEAWDVELSEKESKVASFRESLDRLEYAYNFVGLAAGFHKLTEQKIKEKSFSYGWLIAIGILMLAVLGLEACIIINHHDTLADSFIYIIPVFFAAEVILVYFFRVVLSHFKSIKTQLLQLELRSALCQFIQGYSNYSSEIKSKDKTALEKFENLIFSGLISNEDSLPSIFDGTEQIAKIIKNLKSS